MKHQITRVSVLQSSKIMTALYVLIGIFYTLIGIPMILLGGPQYKIIGYVYLFMPILIGVIGFIMFVIMAALYNLLAKWTGGFEFELTPQSETPENFT